MKKTFFIFLLIISSSCTDLIIGPDPVNTHLSIFEEFWKGVNTTWPEFANKHVNWDSLYRLYRPQAETATSDEDLKKILSPLVNSLKDQHTDIYIQNKLTTATAIRYNPLYPKNFYGFSWVSKNYLSNVKTNRVLGYQLINQEVGYIYIATFSNPHQISDFELIDQILQEFGTAKAIIIDVRSNTGGSSLNSDLVASRFADKKHTNSYYRHRVSAQRSAMSEFVAQDIAPAGKTQFKGRVAILTNRYSFSATENFILAMKSFPNVIHLGDFSGGGSGTSPVFRELPMGWSYRISSLLLCDAQKEPITNGIKPDIFAQTTKSDSLNGKDSIIERAIFELTK
ncbi:MAG: S41 family peptidase [Chryseotalea sp. WA131a]|nr:MAG: S41 family peptidase [Chryseotalea sp. WA131a]